MAHPGSELSLPGAQSIRVPRVDILVVAQPDRTLRPDAQRDISARLIKSII